MEESALSTKHWDTVKKKIKQKHVMKLFIDLSNTETHADVASCMENLFKYAKYGELKQ